MTKLLLADKKNGVKLRFLRVCDFNSRFTDQDPSIGSRLKLSLSTLLFVSFTLLLEPVLPPSNTSFLLIVTVSKGENGHESRPFDVHPDSTQDKQSQTRHETLNCRPKGRLYTVERRRKSGGVDRVGPFPSLHPPLRSRYMRPHLKLECLPRSDPPGTSGTQVKASRLSDERTR